jgi:uncharacterized protein (DUF1810 family)
MKQPTFMHFLEAQIPIYDRVLAELEAGKKEGHWMWFIFPQLKALGHSPTAKRFGLKGLFEARSYLAHRILGPRLVACTNIVIALSGRSLNDIFSSPDDFKFRSCMTLFAHAAPPDETAFDRALERYCLDGEDLMTIQLLHVDRQ